jgi:hypothetical protein
LDRLGLKIGCHLSLSSAEATALAAWLGRSIRSVRAGVPLIQQGGVPSEINIVLNGWAAAPASARAGGDRSSPSACPATSASSTPS